MKDDKSVFPETAFQKVINTLKDKKIDYQVIFKDYNPISKKYCNFNNYHKILNQALEYNSIQIRIKRIQEKINEIIDNNKLEKILKVVEKELQ